VGVPLLLWLAMRCALSYYGIIISRLYLLVKSLYKTFSRFFINYLIIVLFLCSLVFRAGRRFIGTRGGLWQALQAGVSAVSTLEK
jgi:hypothetical protein